MIANIQEEIVEKKKWITSDELLEVVAIAESTPGPIAINMATYVGYKQNKFLGAVCSTIGCVLPSLIIIFIISLFFDKLIQNIYVAYAFVGIKAAVALLIIKSALKLAKDAKLAIWQIIILVLITILMIVLDLFSKSFSAIYLIIIGAVLGLVINFLLNLKKKEETK